MFGDRRALMLQLLTLGAVAGSVALFLPFADDTSPITGLSRYTFGVWRLAAPFFLIVAISFFAIRFARSGRSTGGERVAAYVLAAGSAGITLSVYLSEPNELIGLAIPVVLLMAGGWLVWRNAHRPDTAALNPITALIVPYLLNLLVCLLSLREYLQVGAYVSAAAGMVLLVVLLLASRAPVD